MNELVKSHPELFVVFFPLIWFGVLYLLGHLGGWSGIAAEYRAREPFDGKRWSFQSGQFGWSNYGSCVTVGANPRGVYFSVLFPFRPGHPPLFVPWEDVSMAEGRGTFTSYVDLRFRRVSQTRVRLSKRLGDRLRSQSGSTWPGAGSDAKPIEPS